RIAGVSPAQAGDLVFLFKAFGLVGRETHPIQQPACTSARGLQTSRLHKQGNWFPFFKAFGLVGRGDASNPIRGLQASRLLFIRT
ncbi:MAG: hypothetical protein RBQ87_04635, partial [Candidatus Cloacimonadaceae bacterium]|nr:hypothetical protein [Candidatus Cloacimonadaceae bacterium]